MIHLLQYHFSKFSVYFLLLFLTSLLFACSGTWSREEENFVQTYTEVLIAREQFAKDTALSNAKVQAIFRQHGMTEAAFRQRFNEISTKPDKLRQMLDSARNRARRIGEEEVKKEQQKAEAEKKKTKDGDEQRDTATRPRNQAPAPPGGSKDLR
jgi:hypothetical protein